MSSSAAVSVVVAVFLTVAAASSAAFTMPDSAKALLTRAAKEHHRLFPTFRFEGFDVAKLEAVSQPAEHFLQHLLGGDRGGSPQQTTTQPFPQDVLWLLNMFEDGYGFPRGYNDVLPNGNAYWGTQTYIESGGMDFNGNHTELDAMPAIIERTLTRYGLRLGAGAFWEMALSLWGAHDVAYVYENEVLYTATTGAAGSDGPGGIADLRCDSSTYLYGPGKVPGNELAVITYPGNVTHFPIISGKPGTPVKTGPGAYFLRFLAPHYKLDDPLSGRYGNDWKYPWPNYDSTATWNVFGIIHFNDWVAQTEENIAGAILGPLQALGFATNNDLYKTTCGSYFHNPQVRCSWQTFDLTPPAMQLAMSILPALLSMQSDAGALYETVEGSNIEPSMDPFTIKLRTQYLAVASFGIAKDILTNYTADTTCPTLLWAKDSFTTLYDGVKRFVDEEDCLTQPNELPYNGRAVVQGGVINASGFFPRPVRGTYGGFDISAQLYALTLFDFDVSFGPGTNLLVWQTAKNISGSWSGNVLTGFGNVVELPEGSAYPTNDVRESTVTFQAINAAQVLSAKSGGDASTSFLYDAQSLYNSIGMLWPQGMRFPDGSYVGSSKRFFNPNGWFENPIANLEATSWSVLQGKNCNPLVWFCGSKPPLTPPPSLLPHDSLFGKLLGK